MMLRDESRWLRRIGPARPGYDGMVVVTIDHSAAPRNVATKIEIITMDQVKLRNRRMTIGKIDLSTGQSVYKPEYLARMAVTGARAGRVHSNFYSFGKFHVIQFSQ